jgi:hypothetical protein
MSLAGVVDRQGGYHEDMLRRTSPPPHPTPTLLSGAPTIVRGGGLACARSRAGRASSEAS